jgi:hypothetical protein
MNSIADKRRFNARDMCRLKSESIHTVPPFGGVGVMPGELSQLGVTPAVSAPARRAMPDKHLKKSGLDIPVCVRSIIVRQRRQVQSCSETNGNCRGRCHLHWQ